MTRWVLHVDLDQFIAAVEVLRHPELRGLPVIVGGDGDPAKRGVVATASYEARAHGVGSGTPLRTAARKIPGAVFLPVDRDAYEAVSAEVMAVLRARFGAVEVLGWDEAFVAAGGDDPEGVARGIQAAIRAATALDCSVGIGGNKLQAKLATGFGKPAGVFRLTAANWDQVLGGRAPDALWGVGRKTAAKLADLGIGTVRELAAADPRALAARFGPAIGPWLVATARGLDDAEVSGKPYLARGHGRETTFQRNISDWDELRGQARRLAALVAQDVAAEGRPAVRIVVKVRYAPFRTYTRRRALPGPAMDPAAIEAGALAALDRFTERGPVRLLGVRAEFAEPGAEPDGAAPAPDAPG